MLRGQLAVSFLTRLIMTSQSIILVDGFEKLLAFWLAVKSDLVAYLKGEREFIVNETSISDVHQHVHNLLDN